MNIQLIRHNIKQLENLAEQDHPAEAAKIALALAKLLLQTPSQTAPRSLYIAYAGAAAAMENCFDTLLQTYQPTEDIAQMEQKLREVNAQIHAAIAECENVTAENQALLGQQQELEKREQELSAQKATIEKLTSLKEKEIPALMAEIKTMETKLAALEAELHHTLEEKQKWLTVFDENLRLIGDLPESVQDKTADEIIADAKAYAVQVAQADMESDEWLRKVITAVEQSKERMTQPKNP